MKCWMISTYSPLPAKCCSVRWHQHSISGGSNGEKALRSSYTENNVTGLRVGTMGWWGWAPVRSCWLDSFSRKTRVNGQLESDKVTWYTSECVNEGGSRRCAHLYIKSLKYATPPQRDSIMLLFIPCLLQWQMIILRIGKVLYCIMRDEISGLSKLV